MEYRVYEDLNYNVPKVIFYLIQGDDTGVGFISVLGLRAKGLRLRVTQESRFLAGDIRVVLYLGILWYTICSKIIPSFWGIVFFSRKIILLGSTTRKTLLIRGSGFKEGCLGVQEALAISCPFSRGGRFLRGALIVYLDPYPLPGVCVVHKSFSTNSLGGCVGENIGELYEHSIFFKVFGVYTQTLKPKPQTLNPYLSNSK